ncbi:MAG: hypothetical protein RID91_07820 [Azospirillaceae bacterium]
MARNRRGSVFAQSSSPGVGTRLLQIVLVLVLLVIGGGVVYLGFGDLDPRREVVEKEVDDSRFGQ